MSLFVFYNNYVVCLLKDSLHTYLLFSCICCLPPIRLDTVLMLPSGLGHVEYTAESVKMVKLTNVTICARNVKNGFIPQLGGILLFSEHQPKDNPRHQSFCRTAAEATSAIWTSYEWCERWARDGLSIPHHMYPPAISVKHMVWGTELTVLLYIGSFNLFYQVPPGTPASSHGGKTYMLHFKWVWTWVCVCFCRSALWCTGD